MSKRYTKETKALIEEIKLALAGYDFSLDQQANSIIELMVLCNIRVLPAVAHVIGERNCYSETTLIEKPYPWHARNAAIHKVVLKLAKDYLKELES